VSIVGSSTADFRVLITGGSGLLALNWACAVRDRWNVILGTHQHSVELKGVGSYQLDLHDPTRLGHQFGQLSPDLVVHTAGLADVDRCEETPALALQVNAELSQNVAQVAAYQGIRLIHISTDHLFAGDHSLYGEDEPPTPLNEYGRSKGLAEKWVQKAYPEALILRTNFFGWGHAHRQSFSDWIVYGLRDGKNLSLFDDVYFTPILADSLALLAHELAEKGASGIFNLVGDERLSKYQFALRLARCFGLSDDLIRRDRVTHANLSAKRPRDMSLDNTKARKILGRELGCLDSFLSALQLQEMQGRRRELFCSVSQ
jgi:dTDP-4-dehydrorhamnose reductase